MATTTTGLRDSISLPGDAEALRARLAEDGRLFLRGLLTGHRSRRSRSAPTATFSRGTRSFARSETGSAEAGR